MDAKKEQQITNYVQQKEENNGLVTIAETVADLAGVEQETKESFLSNWLKNDENLLAYAELAMKTEKLSFGEAFKQKLLELKLSVTCPYFADFKEFLEELKSGPDTSTDVTSSVNITNTPSTSTISGNATNTPPTTTTSGNVTNTPSTSTTPVETSSQSTEIENRKFCGTKISNIKSEPFSKNSVTGVTWCSKTARFNGYNFGLNLPSGDAYDAGAFPGKDSIQTIPKEKINIRPQKSWKGISISEFRSINKGNYADIYVNSKSNYGHRATAFRDNNGQWYVLDPYTRVNGKLDNSPKKLEDYLKRRKIVKAHIYQSRGYRKTTRDDDSGTGYEWGSKKFA